MKRKTNLFYTLGLYSNFITFSNYTENLTGSCLSTDSKIFPIAFLCFDMMKLKKNDSTSIMEARKNFIKYLCGRYENKLASLRDKCNENDLRCEDILFPLGYLIDAIRDYEGNGDIPLKYIGSTIEYDYNGIYNDTICTINGTDTITNVIKTLSTKENYTLVEYNFDSVIEKLTLGTEDTDVLKGLFSLYTNYELAIEHYLGSEDFTKYKSLWDSRNSLYNWTNLSEKYNVAPVYDDTTNASYDSRPNWESLTFTVSEKLTLSFNVIVPLYSVVNTNDVSIIDTDIMNNGVLPLGDYNKLVPLGMWFCNDDAVTLSYNEITKDRVNWSLTFSSQFKPFPYSENSVNSNEGKEKQTDVVTLAEVFKNLDRITTAVTGINNSINNLNSRLEKVERVLRDSNLYGTETSNQAILERLEALQNYVTTELSNINIKWTER